MFEERLAGEVRAIFAKKLEPEVDKVEDRAETGLGAVRVAHQNIRLQVDHQAGRLAEFREEFVR